jgi:uncharacterized protein (TIGR03437 family)
MLTLFRLAPVRFTTFAAFVCFFALGRFDTAQAQVLTVSSTNLTFTAPQGGNPSGTQNVNVGSTGGNLNYTISLQPSGSWLSAAVSNGFGGSSTSGTAPDTLTVQINSTTLANGTYSGTITLTPNNGTTPAVITISLAITGSGTTTSTISASPSQLSFGYELKQTAPPAQASQITSSGISLPISSFVPNFGNCQTGWFSPSLSTNSTPTVLTITIVTAGLSPGTCTGNVLLTSTTTTNSTTTALVGVTLFVSTGPLLNISIPTGLQSVTAQQGGRPIQFGPTSGNALILTSSDPTQQVNFSLTTSSTNGWLSLSPPSGTTPASIDVQITPGNQLSPGTYNGAITITPQGLLKNVTTIPIVLTITSASAITLTPCASQGCLQTFTEAQGGVLPSPITLTLTGAPAQSQAFTTSIIQQSGGAWLQLSPASGNLTATPTSSSATLTLSVAANALAQGTYSSQGVITFQNSSIPQIIFPVSLTVQPPAPALVATPSAVTFSYQAGSATPPSQTITISNPAASALNYTVSSVSDSWFSVAPPSGSTPGILTISVSPQSLLPGSYNGSFTLTSPNVPTTTVTVALFISASATPQPFIISNSASGVGSQLSPGEIITIKGSGLGPGNPVSFSVNTLLNPALSGVEVTFNGNPGTLLYVSSTQINVTVPYEIAGATSASIVVSYQGVQSSPITQPVAATSLGLFTDNASGSGQAAVLNQNYTYNTAATPATQGSFISVYATGGGQTNPASTDGEVSPTTSLLPLILQSSATATIGGKPATVTFAGAAPGYVTGVVQFNIQVPIGVSGSALPIVVSVNGSQSQTGATVAVQ